MVMYAVMCANMCSDTSGGGVVSRGACDGGCGLLKVLVIQWCVIWDGASGAIVVATALVVRYRDILMVSMVVEWSVVG